MGIMDISVDYSKSITPGKLRPVLDDNTDYLVIDAKSSFINYVEDVKINTMVNQTLLSLFLTNSIEYGEGYAEDMIYILGNISVEFGGITVYAPGDLADDICDVLYTEGMYRMGLFRDKLPYFNDKAFHIIRWITDTMPLLSMRERYVE